jgi:uncharacterized protein DUF4382
MPLMTRITTTASLLLALCATFAGCSSRTNVSATGSTPTQFTNVFITAQAVWFNTKKSASPDDSGWSKFPLKTPVTIDLVQQSNGTLGEIANDLRLAPGTYNSILLLPVDPALPLTTSAQALNATHNQEAVYADAADTHHVELIIPNPEKGIVIAGSLKVPVGKANSTTGIGVGSNTNNNTTNNAQTLFGSPTTVNPTNNNSTSSTTNNTTTASFGLNFDANRDLHMFHFPKGTTTSTGVLLSSSATATDLSTTGGITGTLTLTTITNDATKPSIANTYSSRTNITASAEILSTDTNGTPHYVIVASAPVESGGTFTIYPLPSNSRNPTAYDLVIHGPNIATIIIKNVSVTTTTPTLTGAADTTGAVATTTASGAVSVGTLIPRSAFSYPVNLNLAPDVAEKLPPGAALTFYQTIGNDAPHAIDEVGIDPVNRTLVTPEALGTATVDMGTYGSNGGKITLTGLTPNEKTGNYLVGATAPMYADALSTAYTVTAPSSTMGTGAANATNSVLITAVPTLQPANAAGTGSINATITDTTGDTAGTLLVSHNGAIIAVADLGQVLSAGGIGTVPINGLPTGNVYYLSAIRMNTSTGFQYESVATPVNLTGSSADATVTIN